MSESIKQIETGGFQPFAAIGAGEATIGGFDIAKRQAELNVHGYGMVAALSRGVPEMLRGGIVARATKGVDSANGQERFTTVQTEGGYAGGWREFTHDGRTKLIHVTLVSPDETERTVEGSAEVKIADPKLIGQTRLPGNERSVHVRIDNQGAPHVTGSRDSIKFSVDYPNPRSKEADLVVAGAMFNEAAAGLTAIAEGIPLGLPELPAAQ